MTPAVAETDPERALGQLAEMVAGLRSCAILGAKEKVLAASAPNEWEGNVRRIWRAAEAGGGAAPDQVHVATEAGELFAVRAQGVTAIALTDRFALASLMFCDLRAVLRGLAPTPASDSGSGSG